VERDQAARAQVLVVGAGPAGLMLGYLLARAGVHVTVLEKHEDFFRDFRGDTIHPSTLELLAELDLLDAFLARPHQEMTRAALSINGEVIPVADFTHLPTTCKFIAFAPQWEFLNFIREAASGLPHFRLLMEAEAVDLIKENDQVVGVLVNTAGGVQSMRADLVVAADGRHSIIRTRAGLTVRDFGAPIDVLWMRLAKPAGTGAIPLGFIDRGKFLVLIDRDDYYQAAWLIPKGGFEAVKSRGLAAFQESIVGLAPFLSESVRALDDWQQVKLLTVRIDRLDQWSIPGLLFIGDSAHAMSPVGGIGINLAIQDAVATANLLARKLRSGTLTPDDLLRVQERRGPPTRQFQTMQTFLHRTIVNPRSSAWAVKLFRFLLKNVPAVGRRFALILGIGLQPEHIDPDLFVASDKESPAG
jgi:2-polyprenyl-6-methoxyphenol hydroxylase-like FAD-dependent oxidoreductase